MTTAITRSHPRTGALPKHLHARRSELLKKMVGIAEKMQIPNARKISLGITDELELGAEAGLSLIHGRNIAVSKLYLLKQDDIPHYLHLNGIHDPRLSSDDYLNEVVKWAVHYFNIKEAPKTEGDLFLARSDIKESLLRLYDKPEMAEKALDFTLHHEAGHLLNRDLEKRFLLSFGTTLLSFAAAFAIGVAAGLSWPISIPLSLICYKVFKESLNYVSAVTIISSQERAADETAAHFSGNAEAGARSFHHARMANLYIRNRHPDLHYLYTVEGNNPQDIEHPPLTVREKYLLEYHRNQPAMRPRAIRA